MGISKSKTKTQSTSTSSPLDQYAPYITQGLTSAQNIMNSNQGNLQNLSTQATNIANGFAPQQQTLSSIYTGQNPEAKTYTNLQNAASNDPSIGALKSSIDQAVANPALGTLEGMTNGQVNGDTSGYYKDVLAGKFLTGNPYIDQIVQQGTDAATKAQNLRFAGSGMDAGMSTPYAQALGSAVSDANNQLRYQNYGDERNRQNTVAGLSDSEYNATKDRNLSAASSLGSIYNQGIANKTSAAQALGNQNTADNATSLNAANGSISSIINALGMSGTLSQDQLNALTTAAGIPYAGVNAYSNIVNGLTGKYGTVNSSGTSTTNGNFAQMYLQAASQAAQAAAAG